jgi:glycosyltransferase involved in cell wall biosynthesis
VETEKTGLLVDPGSPEKMAEAMLRMLSDTDLRAKIIPAARQRVACDFDNKPLVRDLAEVYRKEIEAFRNMALSETG